MKESCAKAYGWGTISNKPIDETNWRTVENIKTVAIGRVKRELHGLKK